MLCIQKKMLRT